MLNTFAINAVTPTYVPRYIYMSPNKAASRYLCRNPSVLSLCHPLSSNRRLPHCQSYEQQQSFLPSLPVNGSSNDHLLGNGHWASGFLEIELQVRDYELDQYGVVNNAVYSSYCQHAHHEVAKKLGLTNDLLVRDGRMIALKEMSLKFLAPLKSGDKFVIKVRISRCSTARMFFEHFIYKLPTQETVLEAKTTLVWLDKTYRPVRIPSEVKYELSQQLGIST